MKATRLVFGFLLSVLVSSLVGWAQHGPVRLSITPTQSVLTVGQATQLDAHLMFFSNRGPGNKVTNAVVWSSSDPINIASIGSSSGLVTAISRGTVLITAKSGPFEATAWITVLPAGVTFNSLTVSASPGISPTGLPKGLSNQFLATAHFSDGSTQDVTDSSLWSSSQPTVASINAFGPRVGIATAIALGTTTISANFSGKTGSTSLLVGPAVPVLVSIVPAASVLPYGGPLQLSAFQTFSDNTVLNVTAVATWSSSSTAIATVDNSGTSTNGTITTTGIGPVTITVSIGGKPGTATISVIHSFDAYGGLNNIPCTNTGFFHTQKIGNQWWLCTPAGHAFFMVSVFVIDPDKHIDGVGGTYDARVKLKYGDDGPLWAEAIDKRLKSWGFNSLGPYYNTYTSPTYLDVNNYPVDPLGLNSHPTKLAFTPLIKPGFYSMINRPGPAGNQYLPEAVKDLMFGHSANYSGSGAFIPGAGTADYYDPKLNTWLNSEIMNTDRNSPWNGLRNAQYQNYMVGVYCEDSDQTYGFGATPDFPTTPVGRNHNNLGWIIATMSPLQTANAVKGQLYSDTEVKTKTAWMNLLVKKYGTITNLNKAWGSNYTTFGSTGVQKSETIGFGNGSTESFAHTIASSNLNPSKFSVQIKVGNQIVAGDTGNGMFYGPTLASGTINYATGAISLTFKAAPANRLPIGVSFVQDGWGIGTGLLDEDGRLSHQAWLSKDFYILTGANANVKTDLNLMIEQTAEHFFKTCHDSIKAAFPNTMYLGPANLSNYSAPSRDVVLQAASKYMDLMVGSGEVSYTQQMIDYVGANFGDKPYMEAEYRTANADSALFAYSDVNGGGGGFGTQANRGQSYYNSVTSLQTLSATTSGSHPYVGTVWWQFVDNWGELSNWGLVTTLDNAYDGNEAQVGFSVDEFGYQRGGEQRNYGDALTLIKQANNTWINTH